MQFDLFRISAIDRPPTLFDALEIPPPSKEQWLRDLFSTHMEFRGRKGPFHYTPADDFRPDVAWMIAGRIGRSKKSKENHPPEHGLHEMQRDAWHAMRVMIDPRHHRDGQKIAAQKDQDVASPRAVLKALSDYVNSRTPLEPYILEIKPIVEERSFWQFADKNPVITSVTFELLAPNMFGIEDDFDKDRSDLKKNENSDKTIVQLNSNDGLNVHTPLLKKLVNWTSKGTGRVKAKAKGGNKFDSDHQVKTEKIDEVDKNSSWNELAKSVVIRIFDL